MKLKTKGILKLYVNRFVKPGLAFALFLSFLAPVRAQDAPGFIVDEIIAKVDNYIVMKSELDRAYQEYLSSGGSPSEEVRCQYLAILIRNKLMMAKAEIDSVIVLDAEVDMNTQSRIDMIISQSGNSIEDIEKTYGKTMEQIKSELREQVREQMVVQEMEKKITDGMTITPSETRRFYNRIPKDSLPFFSAEVQVAQIVRISKVSEEQKEAVKKELLALREKLVAGEDFATLARKHSIDPSVISNGGDMGWVGRGRMVPEFEAMCFKMKVGDISMPVESKFGFHIIHLIDRRGNEYHSRHILMSPKPSEKDLENAAAFLDSLRSKIIKDSVSFEKMAKEHSDDVQTKSTGGFFTDDLGGTNIPVEQLDPAIYFKTDSMKIGEITTPMVYRMDDGKDAMRIILLRKRIPPHEASLKDDWNRIQMAALSEKKNKALQKWFGKAQLDVFINIDPEFDFCGIIDRRP